jgi:hypothetical protein
MAADDTRLVRTDDPAQLVKLARENGLSDTQIIRGLAAGSTSYARLKEAAAVFGPLLGIKEADFIRVARLRGSLP